MDGWLVGLISYVNVKIKLFLILHKNKFRIFVALVLSSWTLAKGPRVLIKMSAPLLTKTSQKNENKKRKREDTQQDHTENKIAKSRQPETFTEVEFKVLLRNSSSIFTGACL